MAGLVLGVKKHGRSLFELVLLWSSFLYFFYCADTCLSLVVVDDGDDGDGGDGGDGDVVVWWWF